MSCTRLFLENLPDGIQEPEVVSVFSEYGTVKSVEIKERKNTTIRNPFRYFAYINLDINAYNLQNCLQYFKETQWYGVDVRLQIAKESFLERLKRERVASINSHGSTEKECLENIEQIRNRDTTPLLPEKCKVTQQSITIEQNLENQDEENLFLEIVPTKNKLNHKINISKPSKIEKTQKGEILDKNNEMLINQSDLPAKNKVQSQAECKRLDSLSQKRKTYSLQKKAIKASLSFMETQTSNKIIFTDDDNNSINSKKNGRIKKQLLSMSDSETDTEPAEYFEIKEKFQGKNGEKLLKLQSRFKNDDRFVLNEKFLDDDENTNHDYCEQQTGDIEKEKEKEFEILGDILGKEIKSRNKFDNQPKLENISKSMRRFDPTQPDHMKYEMKKSKKTEKKNEIQTTNDKRIEGKEEPDVSKEVFYEIKEDFRTTLEGQNGFSLLSMFGTAKDEGKQVQIDDTSPIKKRKEFPTENPFKYDSSDDEDQTEQIKPKKKTDRPEILKAWSEPFFFQADDFRLQDGVDFVKRIATGVEEDFSKIRQNLREITKNKVRSNLRKNRPFKKKLGGNRKKKLKRIEKAIKR